MMNKRVIKTNTEKNADTVIGHGIYLENAVIKGIGTVHIGGNVTGQIDLEGHLTIDRGGMLEGEAKAASATIAGCYEGEMTILGTLHLTPQARVSGKIHAGKMIVDDGASLNGSCVVNKESAREAAAYEDAYNIEIVKKKQTVS
jgi:cytoskeletal protein CcmA (bactofilin family)